MTHTSSLKYTFVFGFVGGQLHARKFKKIMNSAGYKFVADTKEADIIVAHSAGTYTK
jgi:hypothetical protein